MDAVRLALGTFTVLPLRAPRRVDGVVAGRAMLLAPLVGLLLAVPAAAVLHGTWVRTRDAGPVGALLAAVLALVVLAWATHGLHLDGLADTADGLGSRLPREQALDVMRRSDVGAFGVAAVVLVVLVQASALAVAVGAGRGWLAVLVAVPTGRLAATWGCARGVPAARADGLGAAVAGTVPRLGAWLVTSLVLAGAAGAGWPKQLAGAAVVAVLVGLAGGLLLRRTATRRLGGTTGDVLGAQVEVATALALLAFALG